MDDLISREALLKLVEGRLDDLRKQYGVYDHYTDGFDECVDRIYDAPAVDAVEVIRCKDCKHYEDHKRKIFENCVREGKLIPMMPNDFAHTEKGKKNETYRC